MIDWKSFDYREIMLILIAFSILIFAILKIYKYCKKDILF